MRVYKVIPGISCNPCCENTIESVISWIEEAEVGSIIQVRILDMSQEEYNDLPEYMGP